MLNKIILEVLFFWINNIQYALQQNTIVDYHEQHLFQTEFPLESRYKDLSYIFHTQSKINKIKTVSISTSPLETKSLSTNCSSILQYPLFLWPDECAIEPP